MGERKPGFYFEPFTDKDTFGLSFSFAFDSYLKELCVFVRLGFWGSYFGYQGVKEG